MATDFHSVNPTRLASRPDMRASIIRDCHRKSPVRNAYLSLQ